MKPTLTRRIFNRIYESVRKKKVLFVGVADYCQNQIKWLEDNNVKVWSIDKNPEKAKYGAKNHIVDSMTNVNKYFKEDYFDVVLLLGVIGYGLDNPEEVINTFHKIKYILREEGSLITSFTKGRGLLQEKR